MNKQGKAKQGSATFPQSSLKDCEILNKQLLFQLGNKTFRQTVGIPMRSDPSLLLADAFVCYYETKWIKQIKK